MKFIKKERHKSMKKIDITSNQAPQSYTETAMGIMHGYLSSLKEVANFPEVNLEIDLSYENTKNLLEIIAYEFIVGINSDYSKDECIEIAEKTIASYFTFLASNEHDLSIKVNSLNDTKAPNTYIGLCILINDHNILSSISGCVKCENNVLTIYTSKLRDMYAALTGVDLSQYGIEDAEFDFNN